MDADLEQPPPASPASVASPARETLGSPSARVQRIQRDKLLFVAGIANLSLHASFTTSPPLNGLLPYLYTVLFMLLLSWRFYTYKRDKYHLFMLDFCYWVNLALLLYIWLFPHSPELLCLIHACASGPLLIAAVVWRNSVVFHDVDKMTSCFLHLSPACLTYVLRHAEGHADDFWYTHFIACDDDRLHCDDVHSGWGWGLWLFCFLIPLAFWVAWCLLYALLVNCAPCTAHWRADKDYQTSYRWIASKPGADLYELVILCGDEPTRKALMFGFLNFVYTALALLPAVVFYKVEVANIVGLGLCGLATVWNGAGFYFHVFSKRYMAQLSALEDDSPPRGGNAVQVAPMEAIPMGGDSSDDDAGGRGEEHNTSSNNNNNKVLQDV